MDPQKLSSLDPKLRDAYQRVMGTVIPQPQPQPEPQSTSSISNSITKPQPAINPQPESIPTPQPIPAQQASNFVQMNSEVPAAPTVSSPNFTAPAPQTQTMTVKKKGGKMTLILFGIVGLIFIIIYTFFWTRILNFKLPFLP